ncbi:hypothetical protein sos41_10380 [Alphaproteobacteria bacterium SO-S41]|nr:hypothetical protein sos41_10380 [Alphaproteobacteria bacterium SO-S41]
MGLLIKHVSAPYAGREIVIADDAHEVRFGRDPGAEVGFPAELDIVGRDHFRLRREVGTWKFVIAKQRPVFSGGRALLDGEELDQAMELQLSSSGGPRLRVEPRAGAAGNIPKTRILAGGEDIGDVVAASRAGGRRLAFWLGGVTLAVAAIAAAYVFLSRDLTAVAGRIPTIEQQVAAVTASADKQFDAAKILGKVSTAVYEVALKGPTGAFMSIGTASVVRMPDGTLALATNAHISEPVLDYLAHPEYGQEVWVVQPKGPDYPKFKVIGAKTHPAYVEFGNWVARMEALHDEARVREVKFLPIGYDVGLLFVAEPDKLGDPLEIAAPDALVALEAGTPLVMTGYPVGDVAGTDVLRPEPTSHTGNITAMTTFYLFHGDPSENLLIQHSLPTAAGASGSPMFNAAGKLVALHDATNSDAMYSMINYGQRIDLLLELMDGSAEAKMPAYRREWAGVEDRLAKTDPNQILDDLVSDFGIQVGAAATEVQRLTLTMDGTTPDGPNSRAATFMLDLDPGAAYLLVAYSPDARPLSSTAFAGDQPIAGSVGGFAVTSLKIGNHDGAYPHVMIGVLDQTSLGATAVTPGALKVLVYKAVYPPA